MSAPKGLKYKYIDHIFEEDIMLIAPLPLRQQTTRTNHNTLFDMFSEKGLSIFLGIEIKKPLTPKCRDVLKIVAIDN